MNRTLLVSNIITKTPSPCAVMEREERAVQSENLQMVEGAEVCDRWFVYPLACRLYLADIRLNHT